MTEKFKLPEVIVSEITPLGSVSVSSIVISHAVLEKDKIKKEITRVICDCLEGYLSILHSLIKLGLVKIMHTLNMP